MLGADDYLAKKGSRIMLPHSERLEKEQPVQAANFHFSHHAKFQNVSHLCKRLKAKTTHEIGCGQKRAENDEGCLHDAFPMLKWLF